MIKFIKDLTSRRRISFKSHALVRMVERSIQITDVLFCIKNGEVIKEYCDDRPLASYLILGYTSNNKPLHVLCAPDDKHDLLWIITVYKPDSLLWTNDFKKRKK